MGAVDLQRGEFEPFDLTKIASGGGPNKRQDYIDALMASTAIPVGFPPVFLPSPAQPAGRQIMYVDGGVRRNIFIEALVSAIKARGAKASPATVYCLVNGARTIAPAKVAGFPKLLKIAQRSVDILLNESTEGNLFRIYLRARAAGIEFRVTAVPPDVARRCKVLARENQWFDPELMRCLYEAGREIAQNDPRPWEDDPLVGSQ